MDCIIGQKAPDFNLKAVSGDGEDFFDVSLNAFKGHWLILIFYPMDFTFVCPTELTAFSREAEHFKQADARLLAISTDSEYCHQAWIRHGLGHLAFPLVSDKALSMSRSYGVLSEDEGISKRGLFIIDPEQIIRYSVIHDNNIGRSTDEVHRVLSALRTKSVCGANWAIGSQPLQISQSLPEARSVSDPTAIRIYTLPDCSYCLEVKKFLLDNNLSYEEINLEIDREGQEFMESRGYTSLPVTVIGNYEISGFRLDKIREILSRY